MSLIDIVNDKSILTGVQKPFASKNPLFYQKMVGFRQKLIFKIWKKKTENQTVFSVYRSVFLVYQFSSIFESMHTSRPYHFHGEKEERLSP
jgi:hypothetical protein